MRKGDRQKATGNSTKVRVFSFALCAMLLALAFPAQAQQLKKIRRIGFLSQYSPSDPVFVPWYQAFLQGLRDLGWVEEKNMSIEYRYAEGRSDHLPNLATDLVRLKVEVIVASTAVDALAAKGASRTIPIVMAAAGDPLATGLVESLARPGGNITGLSQMSPDVAGKRLELLNEIVPKLARVAVLWNPQTQTSALSWKEIQHPARELGLQLHSLEVGSPNDFDKAFEDATRARAGALAVMPGPLFIRNLKRIAELAEKSRLPSIAHVTEFADSGGLVSYGPDRSDLFRRAAIYVDKILKGAKPAELPVEQPMKFELIINLKASKQIGLAIPPNVLARADRVIK